MSDQLNAIEILVRSEQSDGRIGIVRNTLPGRWSGPPLHHHEFDEAFYVLEGELTFQLGDERRTAGPGELVFAPGGAVHTFANLADAPARYLIACTPGGFERYFARLAAQIRGEQPPAWALADYPQTTVVGPPIASGAG
jgi:mannose-6-phosphate isomerase-like protein (cupin superfamily)